MKDLSQREFVKKLGLWVTGAAAVDIFAPRLIRAQGFGRTAAFRGAAAGVVPNGLLAWWKLDESSGTSAADSSGNGKTGSLVNAPAWGAGQFGNGLTFAAASSQKVTAGDIGLSGLSAASVACWMKRTSASNVVTVGNDPDNSNRFTVTVFSDGNVYLLVNATANGFGTFALSTSNTSWNHFALVFDGTQIDADTPTQNAKRLKGYLNGVQQTLLITGTIGSTLATMTAFEMGNSVVTPAYSNGSIDSVRVYNRAITAGEVALLFANQ